MRDTGPAADPTPEVYLPQAQQPFSSFTLVVRGGGDAAALAGPVRAAIHAIDPAVPISDVATLEQLFGATVARPRFSLFLLGSFALLALAIAAVGTYGVMSFLVGQRTREIGVRVALGARRGAVMALIMREALRLGAAGVALGLALALALTRALATLLFGVRPTDPATYAGVAAVLGVLLAIAAYLPARRAARVDPMTALRSE